MITFLDIVETNVPYCKRQGCNLEHKKMSKLDLPFVQTR